MKKYLVLAVIFFACFKAQSATIPVASFSATTIMPTYPAPILLNLSKSKIKDIEKLLGRKMKFKEKIAFKVYQWQLKKELSVKKEEGKKDKGKTAMILGIIGLASIFVPYLVIISIPCTILALVFGYQAKKINPEDSKARTAVILGWITVGVYVLVIALVIALLAAWGWG